MQCGALAPSSYFFLKPAGHFGEIAVIFLDVSPFTQVIDFFLATTVLVAMEGGFLKLIAN